MYGGGGRTFYCRIKLIILNKENILVYLLTKILVIFYQIFLQINSSF